MDTREVILLEAKKLYSNNSINFSMRQLAEACHIGISVLYYYFKNKDELLKTAFDTTNTSLGLKRKALPFLKDTQKQLRQRVEFQLEHAQDVIFILKYFMSHRNSFEKNHMGYIPIKGHLHIKEVLEVGVEQNIFNIPDIDAYAKIITHTINGFILEYYPDIPIGKKRTRMIDMITSFLLRTIADKSGEKNTLNT